MDEVKTFEVKNSMAEIFINFLSFLLLGIVSTAAGMIFFQVINKYFSDVLFNNFNTSAIHYSIASLIVGLPIYFWAMHFWFKSFSNSPQKIESRLSKWLTYIVLLIAGGMVIGDLIAVIFNFLQGEYNSRFFLKALVIFVIAGLVFGFYFLERKKIQYKKEVSSNLFWLIGGSTGFLAILAVILGFLTGGTPQQTRLKNLDLQRVGDLEQISSCLSNFFYDNGRLPANFNELENNVRYSYCASRILDPETGKNYEYKIISENKYELCAKFSLSATDEPQNSGYFGLWARHNRGTVCNRQTATSGEFRKNLPVPTRP